MLQRHLKGSRRASGFTRPKVLVLLPFRAHALAFVRALCALLPPFIEQVENKARFEREYGEEEGAAPCGVRPADYQHLFDNGNDDCFRSALAGGGEAVRAILQVGYRDRVAARHPLATGADGESKRDIDWLSSIEVVLAGPPAQFGAIRRDSAQFCAILRNSLTRRRPSSTSTSSRCRTGRTRTRSSTSSTARRRRRATPTTRACARVPRRRRRQAPPVGAPRRHPSASSRRSPRLRQGRRTDDDAANVPRRAGVPARMRSSIASTPTTRRRRPTRGSAFGARILPSIVRSLADGADGRTLLAVVLEFVRVRALLKGRASRRVSVLDAEGARARRASSRASCRCCSTPSAPLLPPPPLPGRAQPRAPRAADVPALLPRAHQHARPPEPAVEVVVRAAAWASRALLPPRPAAAPALVGSERAARVATDEKSSFLLLVEEGAATRARASQLQILGPLGVPRMSRARDPTRTILCDARRGPSRVTLLQRVRAKFARER